MSAIAELISRCNNSVTIQVNDHRDYYQSVEDSFKELQQSGCNDRKHIEDEVYLKMVEFNTIIRIQFYPRTAIGFYVVYHYDIDKAIEECIKILNDE